MQWMSEATAASFDEEVIRRSSRQLTLVDFWAPWCAPCRTLGPLLESAIEVRQGRVWLAKVNADKEKSLAINFRVQGIPAVKAFLDGQLVDEFVGLRDRRFIDAFIDRLLPSSEESALQRAESLLKSGSPAQVAGALGPALESPRHRDEALLLLARAQVAEGAFTDAEKTLAEVADDGLVGPRAVMLRTRIDLLKVADGADLSSRRKAVEERPDDAEARWALAGSLLAGNKPDQALEQLLELLQRNRAFRDDGARRAMLGILDELGADHDVSREYRRRMQVYL